MLAADLGGIAIALSLLTGIAWHQLVPVAAILVWITVWRAPFGLIENGPALLGLVTLSFWVGIVKLSAPSHDLLPTLWRPEMERHQVAEYLFLVAAILGAVVSPYLLFFYSSGAREEQWSRRSLGINRATAVIGIGYGSTTAIALIVLAAMVLGPLGLNGGTLAEMGLGMAKPLGATGAMLFASALLVTAFGAALELVLAVGYNVAQGFGWEWSEKRKPAGRKLLLGRRHQVCDGMASPMECSGVIAGDHRAFDERLDVEGADPGGEARPTGRGVPGAVRAYSTRPGPAYRWHR